ncbi:hypothetical protein CHISP_0810 [Chitinispirillum alkaliphilum]|nr:hypothetical protein CHISP_0810 [Chitinispirillum alkaliphilum]
MYIGGGVYLLPLSSTLWCLISNIRNKKCYPLGISVSFAKSWTIVFYIFKYLDGLQENWRVVFNQ